MKQWIIGALVVACLWAVGGVGQGVALPPAEEEVAALEDAFAQVAAFFRALITDFRLSFTTLTEKVQGLEKDFRLSFTRLADRVDGLEKDFRASLTRLAGRVDALELDLRTSLGQLAERTEGLEVMVADLRSGLAALAEKHSRLEEVIGPAVQNLEERVAFLEDTVGSFDRRLLAFDQALGELQVRVDNNRAKIEGLELALAGLSEQVTTEVQGKIDAALAEVQALTPGYEQSLADLTARLEAMEKAQGTMWTAIVVLPLLVGGLVFLLLSGR